MSLSVSSKQQFLPKRSSSKESEQSGRGSLEYLERVIETIKHDINIPEELDFCINTLNDPRKTDGFIKQFPENSQNFVRRLLGNREYVERIKIECSEKFNNLKEQRIRELLDQQSPDTIKELHNRLQHSMHDNRNQKDQSCTSCTKKAFYDETFINAVKEKHSKIFRFS